MNLAELKEKDWTDFEAAHPRAVAFLVSRSLRNERERLERREGQGVLTEWEKDRLAELRAVGVGQ